MASSNAPHIFSIRDLKSKPRNVGLRPTSAVWINSRMNHRIGHRIFLLSAANCVQIFVRFRSWITARPRLVRFVAPAILLRGHTGTVDLDAQRDPSALERHRCLRPSNAATRAGNDPAIWPALLLPRTHSALPRLCHRLCGTRCSASSACLLYSPDSD